MSTKRPNHGGGTLLFDATMMPEGVILALMICALEIYLAFLTAE